GHLAVPSIHATSAVINGTLSSTTLDASNIAVANGGSLRPLQTRLAVTASGTLTVDGAIDATGSGNCGCSSHYGSVDHPEESGVGGVLRLSAAALTVNGSIRSNGVEIDATTGGAGGSIWITAGRISGTGTIEANGSAGTSVAGGGGAIAVDYSDPASVLPSLITRGGPSSADAGPAGSVFLRGPASVYGDLVIDNGPYSGNPTELPAMGHDVAGSGSTGATLVTYTSFPSFFSTHWIEIASPAGVVKGLWRIASMTNNGELTLQPNAAETISIEENDAWHGVYRFDNVRIRHATVLTIDKLVVTNPIDLDASSAILGNNQGAPRVNLALISLQPSQNGIYMLVGSAGAVSDPDTPLRAYSVNESTGLGCSGTVQQDGSFSVCVQGSAGDRIDVAAADSNYDPMYTVGLFVGALPSNSALGTRLSAADWSVDSSFGAETIRTDGRILGVSSSPAGVSSSDKLVVLDLADPGHPTFTRTIATGSAISDFALQNGWAFVAGDTLTTVDLTTAASTPSHADANACGRELAVAVAQGLAFTSESDCANTGRVFVYDVSNPATPRYLSAADLVPEGGVAFTGLLNYGDYLIGIAPSSQFGVVVIDRRQPNALARAGTLSIPNFQPWRGRIRGSLLYLVNTSQYELVIVDLANPQAPSIAARVALPSSAGGVLPLPDSVLVAATYSGLLTVSASASSPAITDSVSLSFPAYDVVAFGEYAYVADESGMDVLTISTAPAIDASRIAVNAAGGVATITGSFGAITGRAPVSAELRNATSGASIVVAVAADGTFSANLPVATGDVITVKATDAIGRIAGPVQIGTIQSASSVLPVRLRTVTQEQYAELRRGLIQVAPEPRFVVLQP
ncbi:MAG: hypothetical protein ACXV5L_09850, partial [Thermoanaerobaculia bacterium]